MTTIPPETVKHRIKTIKKLQALGVTNTRIAQELGITSSALTRFIGNYAPELLMTNMVRAKKTT